ncbi:protein NipSnap homolog 3A isoform X2 [Hyla sarda]|uniref:protein NipSnap homolog 3A isoform X2 n=1 Tax=Hyla sarda TaxID=327740 RepID=UPI0024C31F07|nr:protein NipSnap homolog 3A isoform X2 [Hyla sarda]
MMCALRSLLLKGKLPVAPARSDVTRSVQAKATFATGSRQHDTTLYEFRTYSIKPSVMNAYMELTKENFHLRMAHSEMVGFWTYELGGLNKVFHIWKYDSFTHRSAVRAKLAQDKSWQENYLAKALPMIEKQDNEITYLVPWCKLQKPEKEGVYEMVSFQFKPGGPAVWGASFQAAISTHVNTGYTKLVGVFNTEYGLLNQVRESVRFLDNQRNVLLIPAPFSPLK